MKIADENWDYYSGLPNPSWYETNNNMKISYAIPVCNELMEIQRLISFLLQTKQPDDEVVVLFDSTNGSDEVKDYLMSASERGGFKWYDYPFDGHFGNMKNHLTSLCSGDYIFQIDADELPHAVLMENIHDILELNDIDVIVVPRVNTVEGLTEEHIKKWGWNVNEDGWVNWPDYQWRIYKNSNDIKWVNKVHEKLDGYTTISNLPNDGTMALFHPKTIERQEKQNNYYDTL
jgi:glycosyltransferase involved in cell wall biosynthesis